MSAEGQEDEMNAKTRRVIRTALQVLLALAVALPVLVETTGLTVEQAPWLGTVLVVAAAVARVMQSDVAEALLRRWGLATPADGEVPPVLPPPSLEGGEPVTVAHLGQVDDAQVIRLLREALGRRGGQA